MRKINLRRRPKIDDINMDVAAQGAQRRSEGGRVMRSRICLAVLAAALALGPPAGVRAQSVPLRGTIFSASTNVKNGATTKVATTPASGKFILTQFCAGGPMSLAGATFGFIAAVGSAAGGPACASFKRGYALPSNEPIQCTNTNTLGASVGCSISAVIE